MHKRPESVLVVVYTCALEFLVLERAGSSGFWQSVTGSMEWHESPAAAAARELTEETGLEPKRLVDSRITRDFELHPQWRSNYAAEVQRNVEHQWELMIPRPCEVRLSPSEHTRYEWVPAIEAVGRVFFLDEPGSGRRHCGDQQRDGQP